MDEGLLHRPGPTPGRAGGHRARPTRHAAAGAAHAGQPRAVVLQALPGGFERFKPACLKDDLRLCSREEITNAYDNALLYTDHVLALLIQRLQAASATVDTAMLYASDHGESLGENNLYLHGLPYAIAPKVQKRVPMVLWASAGLTQGAGALDLACLQKRATQPAAHDHLFHTVLGLLDVKTTIYEPAFDLSQGCRAP
jgi:lipid A ethanolaminephosphotransferase